jgi:hypothetical protein
MEGHHQPEKGGRGLDEAGGWGFWGGSLGQAWGRGRDLRGKKKRGMRIESEEVASVMMLLTRN